MKKLVFLFLLCFSFTINADIVYLKDGRKLTGEIESITSSTIVIITDYGKITVNRSQVAGGVFYQGNGELIKTKLDPLLDLNFLDNTKDLAKNPNKTEVFGKLDFEDNQNASPKSAIKSSGKGNYLKITPTKSLVDLNAFTLHFKIKPSNISQAGYVFSFYADKNNTEGKIALFQTNGMLVLYLMDKDKAYHSFTLDKILLENNKWDTITITFDNSKIKAYKNYAEAYVKDTKFSDLNCPDINFYLFTAYNSKENNFISHNFASSLEFFKIYDQALSLEEIIKLK